MGHVPRGLAGGRCSSLGDLYPEDTFVSYTVACATFGVRWGLIPAICKTATEVWTGFPNNPKVSVTLETILEGGGAGS